MQSRSPHIGFEGILSDDKKPYIGFEQYGTRQDEDVVPAYPLSMTNNYLSLISLILFRSRIINLKLAGCIFRHHSKRNI